MKLKAWQSVVAKLIPPELHPTSPSLTSENCREGSDCLRPDAQRSRACCGWQTALKTILLGLPWWPSGKESIWQYKVCGFNP